MSKTVKRVSETVKRVTRVMMVGLVTIMGVQAEAHYIVIGGRCYWHSGQCVRQDEDVPPPPIVDIPRGDIVARNVSVEVLCPGFPQPPFITFVLPAEQTLAARAPIDQGDFTERQKRGGGVISNISTNLEWDGVISDALFEENPLNPNAEDFDFCAGQRPRDVIIRSMSVQMNLYCVDADLDPKSPTYCPSPPVPPPGVQKPHSAWKATCTLSDKFNFINYPKNFPSRAATSFDCSAIATCHGENCEL